MFTSSWIRSLICSFFDKQFWNYLLSDGFDNQKLNFSQFSIGSRNLVKYFPFLDC